MKLLRHSLNALAALTVASALGMASFAWAADAPKEAAKDIVLKGDAKCTTCHDEADAPELLRVGKTKHGTVADSRTPSCTNCHGESEKHVTYKGKDKPPKVDVSFAKKGGSDATSRSEACTTCHNGGKHMNWQSSTHATRDVTCTSCHSVHQGYDKVRDKVAQTEVCYTCHKEQRAQMNRPSHHPVPEGKMACSSCHNVHGDNPKQLAKASTNETCYTCHMEKRGPFVHNHQPVNEDCGICHAAHGTNVANLLKTRQPMLCAECHGPSSHPSQAPALIVSQAAGPAVSMTFNTNARGGWGTEGRGCLNCHTNIHGGNSTQSNVTTERFRR